MTTEFKFRTIQVSLDEEAKKMIASKKDLSDTVTTRSEAARSEKPKKCSLDVNEKGYLIVKDRDPARILKALYNASKPVGMGFYALNQTTAKPMTTESARAYIEEYNDRLGWDYVHGRPIKSCIENGYLNPWGFDRDNGGPGTCKRVIEVEFDS